MSEYTTLSMVFISVIEQYFEKLPSDKGMKNKKKINTCQQPSKHDDKLPRP